MSIDEEEVRPSHNLDDMPWDNSFGELSSTHPPVLPTSAAVKAEHQRSHIACGPHARTDIRACILLEPSQGKGQLCVCVGGVNCGWDGCPAKSQLTSVDPSTGVVHMRTEAACIYCLSLTHCMVCVQVCSVVLSSTVGTVTAASPHSSGAPHRLSAASARSCCLTSRQRQGAMAWTVMQVRPAPGGGLRAVVMCPVGELGQ